MAAFEVVEALPTEFDRVREDLEISIADALHKSSIYYTTWINTAMENATTKVHAVIYREKILPALSLNKSPRYNNSTAVKIVSEEARKKFIENWKKQKLILQRILLEGAKLKLL